MELHKTLNKKNETEPKKRPRSQFKRRCNEVTSDMLEEAEICKHRMMVRVMREQESTREQRQAINDEVQKIQQKVQKLKQKQQDRRDIWNSKQQGNEKQKTG